MSKITFRSLPIAFSGESCKAAEKVKKGVAKKGKEKGLGWERGGEGKQRISKRNFRSKCTSLICVYHTRLVGFLHFLKISLPLSLYFFHFKTLFCLSPSPFLPRVAFDFVYSLNDPDVFYSI